MLNVRPSILVPVDLESPSARVLETARWLADRLCADLVLLHVHHRATFEHPQLPSEFVERLQSLVEQAATKSLDELAAASGAAQALFRHGDPAAQILVATREMLPTLVVMATHGRRGVARLLLGSVAEQVVRESPVPVVTVSASRGSGRLAAEA